MIIFFSKISSRFTLSNSLIFVSDCKNSGVVGMDLKNSAKRFCLVDFYILF